MLKKEFLQILVNDTFDDEPIMEERRCEAYVEIFLCHKDGHIAIIHTINMRMPSCHQRLTEWWRRYNKWLGEWYHRNKPLNYVRSNNEWKTTLRSSGYDDEKINTMMSADSLAKTEESIDVAILVFEMETAIEKLLKVADKQFEPDNCPLARSQMGHRSASETLIGGTRWECPFCGEGFSLNDNIFF